MAKAESQISAKLRQSYENDLQVLAPQSIMFPGLHPMAMMSTGRGFCGAPPPFPPPIYAPMAGQGGAQQGAGDSQETTYLYIPNNAVGAIIGTKGSNIRNIIRFSSASVKIAPLEQEKQGEATANPQQERKVTIVGSPEAQWKAQYLIFEKMREEGFMSGSDDVRLTVEIVVASSQVGRIIGKGGQNVRELQRVTGSLIKLPEQPQQAPGQQQEHDTTVHIVGPFYSVQRMRRPRRHRWLTVSVFFIAYSVFQAVFSASIDPAADLDKGVTPAGEDLTTGDKTQSSRDEPKRTTPMDIDENTSTEGDKKRMKGLTDEDDEPTDKKTQKDAGYKEEEEMTMLRDDEKKLLAKSSIPTVHPLRNCTPPAIEQFPRPLMGQYARSHGGLIIHVLVAVFTFIGLAIVCDEYFVSSLDRICEELQLAPDVAGATFMAAGSSAPELATVVIGVFCAQDDIGVSGVIGSAVFNIMFVISVCALCAGTVSHLNWWPLCRDCFFYAISILVMLCTICNGFVSWPEALFMLIMYGVYCVALRFNTTLERWALTLPLPFKLPTREEQAALVTYKSGGQPPAPAAGDEYTQVEGQTKETPLQDTPYNPEGAYENAAYNADPVPVWDPTRAWDPDSAWTETGESAAAGWGAQPPPPHQPHRPADTGAPPPAQAQPQAHQAGAAQPYYKAKEYNPETAVNPLVKPIGANQLQLTWWFICWPVHWACRHTMPDCRGRWYPVTFIISMLWISFYSYFMVWMITIIGYTLGIPDTVMGLTFVAAGVSVPDALSSLAVIKEGYGDMAVSNAVGSNVFDILVCLGLPWFIQTAIIQPGSHVNVISKGLVYSTLSLFSTVIFLVVATHANGWKLDRKYGAVLMVWYILFITLASLYELNVFGDFNQPDCISLY